MIFNVRPWSFMIDRSSEHKCIISLLNLPILLLIKIHIFMITLEISLKPFTLTIKPTQSQHLRIFYAQIITSYYMLCSFV